MSNMIEVFNNMIDVFDAKVPAAPVMSSAVKFERGTVLSLRNPTLDSAIDGVVCLTSTRRYANLPAFAVTKVSVCDGMFVGYLLHWTDTEAFSFSFTRDGREGPTVLATPVKMPS